MTEKPETLSFAVELLPSQKEKALQRLGAYETPGLASYARQYLLEHGTYFQLKGFTVAYTDIKSILSFTGDDHGLKVFAQWAEHNIPARYSTDKPGISNYECTTWVRFPDETWFCQVPGHRTWATIDTTKGGYDNKPTLQRGRNWSHGNFRWASIGGKNSESNIWNDFFKIEEDFPKAWRFSREVYRKFLKSSGEAETFQKEKANKDHVKRTKMRMKASAQASKIRDVLEVYIKSLNDETMTVEEIGSVYYELIKLTEHNKTLKLVYGNLMPKK